MRRFSIADIIVSIVVIVLIALTLAPAIARIQRPYAEARCQSNMRRLAEAIALYTADNNNRYPTNRISNNFMRYEIQLSQPPTSGQDTMRFQYGVNWVEALYPYIQKAAEKTGQDWRTFLKCPNASDIRYGPTAAIRATAAVTYSFNGYLAEYSSLIVQNSEKVIMVRELDRLANALFRPYCYPAHRVVRDGIRPAIGSLEDEPIDPFLATTDLGPPTHHTNNKPHNEGSHILFADGHVRYFTADFMPDNAEVRVEASWDAETKQWYNFKKTTGTDPKERSIAITP